LIEQGFSVEFGAREIQRTVDSCIGRPLAKLLASNQIGSGSVVKIDYDRTGFTFREDCAAEQAIAQRELLVDIPELEHRKLADARSMLKTLSRIALP
jgi:hypothetical protein